MNARTTTKTLLTLLIVLSVVVTPIAATQVSRTTITDPGETAPTAGSTQVALDLTLQSNDTVIHGTTPAAGTASSPFGGVTSYAFVEDGTATAGTYEDGDDVFAVSQIHAGTTDIADGGSVHTFPGSTVYADDSTVSGTAGQYDDGDDLYSFIVPSGAAVSVSDNGTAFSTFNATTTFVDPAAGTYAGTQPIVVSSDASLDSADEILKDGTAGVLTGLSGTSIKHYDDASGTGSVYDASAGSYGEAIYDDADSEGTVSGNDTRITAVTVNSGASDGTLSTIDLGLGTLSAVSSADSDASESLTARGLNPSMKALESSADSAFSSGDTVVLDLTSDGQTSDDVILVDGGAAVGTIGSAYDYAPTGSWLTGTASTVVFDVNSDTTTSGPDFKLSGGSGSFGVATYGSAIGTTTPIIQYWDKNGDASIGTSESVYIDEDDSGNVSGDGTDPDDFRLRGFIVTYTAGSTVANTDVDAGVSLIGFATDEFSLDGGNDGAYTNGDPLVKNTGTTGANLEAADTVLVSGTAGFQNFRAGSSPFDAYLGTGAYDGSQTIITVSADAPTTSGTRNTVPGVASTVTLNGFQTGTGNVEGFVSSDATYTDDEEIVRLSRFGTTSGTPVSIGDASSVTVNAFAGNVGFADATTVNGAYDDGEPIFQEGDQASGVGSTFGDRLNALTVMNQGTLSNANISAVDLVPLDASGNVAGSAIATATERSDGHYAFTGLNQEFYSANRVGVRVTLASDAPAGKTLHFAVPAVSDATTTGAYDSGDDGLFFSQAAPIGSLANDAGIIVDAVTATGTAFVDPADGNHTKVELAFTADLNATSTDAGDFTVRNASGATLPITAVEADDGDGRLVLDLGSGPGATTIASVAIADRAIETANGGLIPGQQVAVRTTSVTVREQDASVVRGFVGERVALLADAGGNHNESMLVEADTDGDGGYESVLFDGTTGQHSDVHVIATAGWNASDAYRVTFRSADGTPGEIASLALRTLALTATASDTTITTDDELGVTATASTTDETGTETTDGIAGRAVNATVYDHGTPVASASTAFTTSGTATFAFGPLAAGEYTVEVVDRDAGSNATTGTISVTAPSTTDSSTTASTTESTTESTTSSDTSTDDGDGSPETDTSDTDTDATQSTTTQTTTEPVTQTTVTSTTTTTTTEPGTIQLTVASATEESQGDGVTDADENSAEVGAASQNEGRGTESATVTTTTTATATPGFDVIVAGFALVLVTIALRRQREQ